MNCLQALKTLNRWRNDKALIKRTHSYLEWEEKEIKLSVDLIHSLFKDFPDLSHLVIQSTSLFYPKVLINNSEMAFDSHTNFSDHDIKSWMVENSLKESEVKLIIRCATQSHQTNQHSCLSAEFSRSMFF